MSLGGAEVHEHARHVVGDIGEPGFEYVLSGDPAVAKGLVESTLVDAGFELHPTPLGGFIASRTSVTAGKRGFWSGILGGGTIRVNFIVEFTTDTESRSVARWNAMAQAGIITGRLTGENPTHAIFRDTAETLSRALTAAGVLTDPIALT